MSKDRKWMPLYIADFIADTLHLNATGIGIYIQLIMYAWDHNGRIPLDNARLARIGKCDPRVWHKYRATILDFFEPVADDQCSTETAPTMQHRRVLKELHRNAQISSKRKAAAEQKHGKRKAVSVQMQTHARVRYQEHIDNLPSLESELTSREAKKAVAEQASAPQPNGPNLAPFNVNRALAEIAELERQEQEEADRLCKLIQQRRAKPTANSNEPEDK